jgi:hypothetical protein
MAVWPLLHELETNAVRLMAFVDDDQRERLTDPVKAPAKALERRNVHCGRRIGSRMLGLDHSYVVYAFQLKLANRLINQGNARDREQDFPILG